jgi:hypothetical protein
MAFSPSWKKSASKLDQEAAFAAASHFEPTAFEAVGFLLPSRRVSSEVALGSFNKKSRPRGGLPKPAPAGEMNQAISSGSGSARLFSICSRMKMNRPEATIRAAPAIMLNLGTSPKNIQPKITA